MDLRRDDLTRIARAPAKLNLFLEVMSRRQDGFHELETVMVPIRLFDTLTFTSVEAGRIDCDGEIRLDVRLTPDAGGPGQCGAVPGDSSNLVARALRLLKERAGCELGAVVKLVKRVPVAAGLGGGSSDAATALRLANWGWQLGMGVERLSAIAAEIGSDVAFFLQNGTAICRGRGERIEPLPNFRPIHFVVVKPTVGLGTANVYQEYDRAGREDAVRSGSRGSLSAFVSSFSANRQIGFARHMWNGLQAAASSLTEWVDHLRMEFDRLDFIGHQLSGSGSAYFGVCRHAQHARRLANILRTRQLGQVYATRSCR
jgi:4-diphosphocytidyl-2-C-methyl-D-erythritol kinase